MKTMHAALEELARDFSFDGPQTVEARKIFYEAVAKFPFEQQREIGKLATHYAVAMATELVFKIALAAQANSEKAQ